MLDTATASLGLMSQRADGGLVRATAPHTASYFYLSKGQSQELSSQRLSLEATNFEAGWPVIDSDFK